MRKVDKLGRIVIPQELRQKYGLDEGTTIEFLDSGEGVTVVAYEPCCKICRDKIADDSMIPLCKSCIEKILKNYHK